MIGTTLGRFRIEAQISSGGMGTIYRGADVETGQVVALKVLQQSLAADRSFLQRFRREVHVLSGIQHPNVVRIYDVGTDDGVQYYAMEHLEKSLAEVLRQGPVPIERAVRIASQVARGLMAVHNAGVRHRDVKPSNILFDAEGNAKIADFGIAKISDATRMTQTGVIVGTPSYMAPEQVDSQAVDPRADIYSLGVVLYEMIVGRPPFDGHTTLEILRKHRYTLPESPKSFRPQVPSALAHLVLSMLAKSPKQRPDSMALVADALDHIERNLERRGMPSDEASPELSSSEQTERYERVAACVIRWTKAVAAGIALTALAYGGYRMISHVTRGPADYLRDAEAAEARDAADALRRYEALASRYPDAPEAGTARERIRALQEAERRRPGSSAPGLFGASGHTLAIRAQIAAIHCSRAEKAVAAGDIEHARQIYRMVRQVFADTPWGLRADHRLYLLDAMGPGSSEGRPDGARREPGEEREPPAPPPAPPAPEPPQ